MQRKILVPLATLVAAGALAVGSGATFDATSANAVSAVTAGTLTMTNSKANQAIFTLTNMKPGDILNGSLTITNSGSLPAKYSLSELNPTNTFGSGTSGNYLKLTVTNKTSGAKLYTGDFQGLGKADLGTVAAGTATDYVFSVTLDTAAPNSEQGKTASASFQWDAVQLPGETINQ